MAKQEQIEEMRRELYCAMSKVNGIAFSSDLAEALYNAGYGNVSEYRTERELLGSQIKVLKQRLNNKYIEVDNLNRDYHNSFERLKAQEREIERLKDENIRLRGKLAQVPLSINTAKEMNAMCDIDDQIKRAVKEFAEKLKMKAFDKDMFNDWAGATYVVLVREIDELLKEYENGKDKD